MDERDETTGLGDPLPNPGPVPQGDGDGGAVTQADPGDEDKPDQAQQPQGD